MMVAMSDEEMVARRCSTFVMVMPVAARAIMRWAPRSKESTATVCSGATECTSSACWVVAVKTRVTCASVRMCSIWAEESDS